MDWFISSTGMFVTDCMAAFGCIAMGYLIGHSRGLKEAKRLHNKKVHDNKITFISIDDLKEK
jgi:hypothetical protein